MNAQMKTNWNKTGLKPLGHAVLVEAYEPEIKKSILAIPETASERLQMTETRAVVLAIGANAWAEEPERRAEVGDRVLISRFAGVQVKGTADGKNYRIINDRDIYCKIEVDAYEC